MARMRKNKPVSNPARASRPSKARQHGVPFLLSLYPEPWYNGTLESLCGSCLSLTTDSTMVGPCTGGWVMMTGCWVATLVGSAVAWIMGSLTMTEVTGRTSD